MAIDYDDSCFCAKEQPDVDRYPSWLLSWEEIDERDRDVDRRIAKALFAAYDNAATDALDAIAKMCGCPDWEYPGQVVRDVERVVSAPSAHPTCERCGMYDDTYCNRWNRVFEHKHYCAEWEAPIRSDNAPG